MKCLIGYTLFCVGAGMLLALLLPDTIFAVIICAIVFLAGYNLFCC